MTDEKQEPVDDQLPAEGELTPEQKEQQQQMAMMQANRELNQEMNQLLSVYAKRLPVLVMAKILSNASLDMMAQQGVFSAKHVIADYKEELLHEQMGPKIIPATRF